MKRVDSRLNVEKVIVKDDLTFRSALDEPFSVHGVFYEGVSSAECPRTWQGL